MQHTRRRGSMALMCWALSASFTPHAIAQGAQPKMKDVRYVVLHKPGPAWMAGKGMFEQPGVPAHVEHYRKWLNEGKLALGGPHLDSVGGGMMIPAAGIAEDEVRAFANADPAVQDGTLIAEVRPWLIGMSSGR